MFEMPYFVYILFSFKDHRLYVGQTENIYKRLSSHFKGAVKATAHRRPLKLIHKEVYPTRAEAIKRERFLKSLWGSWEKKKILGKFKKSNV